MGKKYSTIITKSFLRTIEYRAEIFIWVLLSVLPFLVLLLVWQSIFGQSGEIHSFSLAKIIQYYLLVMIIRRVTVAHFENRATQRIREGKIDYLLTKPISYSKMLFMEKIGDRFSELIFSSPVLFLLIFISVSANQNFQDITPLFQKISQLFTFSTLLIISYIVEWFLAYITVLFAFWYENASGLQHFKTLTITILGGSMMPIPFMPEWLKNLVNHLPFKYLYSVPIAVIQDGYRLNAQDWSSLTVFLLSLLVISQLIWKKGIQKYTSAGG